MVSIAVSAAGVDPSSLRLAGNFKLSENFRNMIIDGPLRTANNDRYIRVGFSMRHPLQDFHLPRRKPAQMLETSNIGARNSQHRRPGDRDLPKNLDSVCIALASGAGNEGQGGYRTQRIRALIQRRRRTTHNPRIGDVPSVSCVLGGRTPLRRRPRHWPCGSHSQLKQGVLIYPSFVSVARQVLAAPARDSRLGHELATIFLSEREVVALEPEALDTQLQSLLQFHRRVRRTD
jgi:hypothetical protein